MRACVARFLTGPLVSLTRGLHDLTPISPLFLPTTFSLSLGVSIWLSLPFPPLLFSLWSNFSFRNETNQEPRRLLSEGVPDWIEKWSPDVFRKVGYGMAAGVVATGAFGNPVTGMIAAVPVGL